MHIACALTRCFRSLVRTPLVRLTLRIQQFRLLGTSTVDLAKSTTSIHTRHTSTSEQDSTL